MNIVGRSEVRVDAFDKATGRTKYYDDLAPKDALLIRVKHSTIAHGFVKSVDISKAEKIPGVVKILTCFDVPDIPFPTAGHQHVAARVLPQQHRAERAPCGGLSPHDKCVRRPGKCRE